MENNELNKRIIENVRNRVVVSNLEREENMKLNNRKKILSIVAAMTIVFTGSFITVNAATNGELVEKVKDKAKIIFTDKDGKQQEIEGTTYTDSNNHIIEKYEIEKDGTEYRIEVDKTSLDEGNLTVKENINDDEETSITIENE